MQPGEKRSAAGEGNPRGIIGSQVRGFDQAEGISQAWAGVLRVG